MAPSSRRADVMLPRLTGFPRRDQCAERGSFSAVDFHRLAASYMHPGGFMRLKDKVAIVIGAGQSPGEGMGNGRATVLRFAQEGAKVLAVDNNLASAEETVALARQAGGGGECAAFEADVTREATLQAIVEAARQRWGRIDILHYNL